MLIRKVNVSGVIECQSYKSIHHGTCSGYMPPEYALHELFSVKSNVFSFGVLVLEIISGKKNSSFHQSGSSDDLLSYVSGDASKFNFIL